MAVAVWAEQRKSGANKAPIRQRPHASRRNMEGGTRFGVVNSALRVLPRRLRGAVESMHDSFTLLGAWCHVADQIGEVIFGGVGSAGMLLLAVVAVFVAGLMIGRTPVARRSASTSHGRHRRTGAVAHGPCGRRGVSWKPARRAWLIPARTPLGNSLRIPRLAATTAARSPAFRRPCSTTLRSASYVLRALLIIVPFWLWPGRWQEKGPAGPAPRLLTRRCSSFSPLAS